MRNQKNGLQSYNLQVQNKHTEIAFVMDAAAFMIARDVGEAPFGQVQCAAKAVARNKQS